MPSYGHPQGKKKVRFRLIQASKIISSSELSNTANMQACKLSPLRTIHRNAVSKAEEPHKTMFRFYLYYSFNLKIVRLHRLPTHQTQAGIKQQAKN